MWCDIGNLHFVTILSHLVIGLGDEPSSSPTPSTQPHSAPLSHSASWECLSTLPTNGSPLRHVTHVRPRPPRRHRAGHLPPESVSWWQMTRRWPLTLFWASVGRDEIWRYPDSNIANTFKIVSGLFSWNLEGELLLCSLCMFNCPIFDLIQHEVQSICFHKESSEGCRGEKVMNSSQGFFLISWLLCVNFCYSSCFPCQWHFPKISSF